MACCLAWDPISETAAHRGESCSFKDLRLQKGAQPHIFEANWPHQSAHASCPSELPLAPHASPPGSWPQRQPLGSEGTMPSTRHTRRSIPDGVVSIWWHFQSVPTSQKLCPGRMGSNALRHHWTPLRPDEAWSAHGRWLPSGSPGVSLTRQKQRWGGSLHSFPPHNWGTSCPSEPVPTVRSAWQKHFYPGPWCFLLEGSRNVLHSLTSSWSAILFLCMMETPILRGPNASAVPGNGMLTRG